MIMHAPNRIKCNDAFFQIAIMIDEHCQSSLEKGVRVVLLSSFLQRTSV